MSADVISLQAKADAALARLDTREDAPRPKEEAVADAAIRARREKAGKPRPGQADLPIRVVFDARLAIFEHAPGKVMIRVMGTYGEELGPAGLGQLLVNAARLIVSNVTEAKRAGEQPAFVESIAKAAARVVEAAREIDMLEAARAGVAQAEPSEQP